MKRARSLVIAAGAVAIAGCSPELWTFDLGDASTSGSSSTSTVGPAFGAPDAGVDARGVAAPTTLDGGLPGTGCPPPKIGTSVECTSCLDSGACTNTPQNQTCGVEKRCVECQTAQDCPDSGPRETCVSEHCVDACGGQDGTQHCEKSVQPSSYCADSQTDAGYCVECTTNSDCIVFGGSICSPNGICVECTKEFSEQCGAGTCAANFYCVRQLQDSDQPDF